jgi:phenylacetate-CoA ligase
VTVDAAHRYFERDVETMSRDALADAQWRAFRVLLRRAWEGSPFYRTKFAAAGLHPDDVRRPDDVVRVPVTTKDEILRDIEAHPPYGSRLRVDRREIVNIVETSGTSGRGREVHVQTAEDLEAIYRAEAYGFVWAGVTKGTVVLLTWPVTMTAGSAWWIYTLSRLGVSCLRVGHLSSLDKLLYARRYGADVLITTPSYLTRLERTAGEEGLDLETQLAVRRIIVLGESRSAAWVARVQERWGAAVSEQWGCTQGGFTWTCEQGMLPGGRLGMMHGLPHLVMLEVVGRDTRRAVASGEEGEIVVTPLGAVGAPLIRFATNDRATFLASDACPCGRPFDGIECGSVSRYDDMLKVKGVNVWPSAIGRAMDRYPEVKEHAGRVYLDDHGREVARVDVEFQAGVDASRRRAIVGALTEALRAEVGVTFDLGEWAGSGALESVIIDGNTGKARRWSDRRPDGPGCPDSA